MRRPEKSLFLFLIAAAIGFGPAAADEAADKGLSIAREADQRDTGFGDASATLQMILRNRHGDQTTRQMRSRTLEVLEDGDKSLMIFDDPADVKGTSFLSFSHKEGDDDQWLYLPALKRVKRISSSNKSGPFMGSEFSYEDLSSQEVEKYAYQYLRDENFDDRDHFVIERIPVDKKSGYRRQITWIDQEEYRVWKVEFYDRKDSLLKTLAFADYKRYLDKHWRASQLDMVNHQTGKSTTLRFEDYIFGNGYADDDFNRNSLAKAR
ncbi:MAG: outer membrane lipoprotein-sorting protein [Gammaproteobacteria bacterium]|nr:outer membrane lipoprotein-sorting protein [Gammaproteobacteria bacterium]